MMRNLFYGNVYAIGNNVNGLIKIGFTTYPVSIRVKNIQSMCPVKVELLWECNEASRAVEKALHKRFAKVNAYGEWFDFTGLDVANELNTAMASFPDVIKRSGVGVWTSEYYRREIYNLISDGV